VCGDSQEGVGEHGEGDMPMPGIPGSDLVMVESGIILALRSGPDIVSDHLPIATTNGDFL
jgi:hypothetical protein